MQFDDPEQHRAPYPLNNIPLSQQLRFYVQTAEGFQRVVKYGEKKERNKEKRGGRTEGTIPKEENSKKELFPQARGYNLPQDDPTVRNNRGL